MAFADFVRERVPRYQPPIQEKTPTLRPFKVGDRVRVVRNVVPGSTDCIGREGVIDRILPRSGYFDCEINHTLFSFEELEHI